MTSSTATIRTLQIGNTWFEEKQGGLGRVYYELSQHLPKVNVDFTGLVIGSSQISRQSDNRIGAFAQADDSIKQRVTSIRSSVRQALSNDSIDLIAAHFALYTFPIMREIRRLPLVFHFHGPWAAEASAERSTRLKSYLQATLERFVYKRAARLIVLSHAFARELAVNYKIPENIIRVVPGGVDTVRFNADISRMQARKHINWPSDRFIVLAVRRLAHRMGLEDLITATQIIAKKSPDILIHIAGTGALAHDLQQQIDELKLADHVKLLGRVDDSILPLLYRAADLSVVPSTSLEGFGMITIESLASGTPVMVTPIGGLPEVVNKLSPALIFDQTGPAAISSGLGEVLRGQRRLPSEQDCRLHTLNNFTWQVAAENVRSVYLEALA